MTQVRFPDIDGRWRFLDFVEQSGRVPFAEWIEEIPLGAQAFVDARIIQMSGLRKWPEKWISKYRGTEKIYELRITHLKVQYRPLGMYAAKMCFVLLAGAIEKGGEIPKDTIKAAVRRQKELDAGEGNVREHRFR